jgi:RNA polymerase sigma-70 factor (ECF subfamily)
VCAECPARLADDLEAAFPVFLLHHQDLVYGIARRYGREPADAEDLAQEAFMRAYRALAGYEPARRRELRPRGWLAAIVVNLARNRARRGRPPGEAGLDDVVEATADPRPGPEDVVARRETARAWSARLDRLPPRYGRAVALRHVSGLSYPELAEALGRPINTVKSDVHRGLAMLRRALDEADEVKA